MGVDFSEYVAARRPSLVRAAVLLGCPGDDAEDLVHTTLTRCLRSWHRIERAERPDAYVHQMLVNALLDARGRHWRGEAPTEHLPESAADGQDVDTGLVVRRALLAMSTDHREAGAALLHRPDRAGDRSGARRTRRHGEVPHEPGTSRPRRRRHHREEQLMRTDEELARELLARSAATIQLGPGPELAPPRRRRLLSSWHVLAAAAVVVAVVLVAVSPTLSGATPTGPDPADRAPAHRLPSLFGLDAAHASRLWSARG